jgi:hypothetical protein
MLRMPLLNYFTSSITFPTGHQWVAAMMAKHNNHGGT